jgi:hypothetical protein
MWPSEPHLSLPDLALEFARVLPEYQPGVSTGTAAITEARTGWIHSWKDLLTAFGRERHFEVVVHQEGDCGLARQLTLFWKQGDAIVAAFLSGWGDREELEARFQKLEVLKAPYKIALYSCSKWQDAVLEQLQAALLRYPHHIAGEQYLLLNVLGAEHKLAAHWITMPRDGSITVSDLERLRPLAGFPMKWGHRQPYKQSEV